MLIDAADVSVSSFLGKEATVTLVAGDCEQPLISLRLILELASPRSTLAPAFIAQRPSANIMAHGASAMRMGATPATTSHGQPIQSEETPQGDCRDDQATAAAELVTRIAQNISTQRCFRCGISHW